MWIYVRVEGQRSGWLSEQAAPEQEELYYLDRTRHGREHACADLLPAPRSRTSFARGWRASTLWGASAD